ncbi:MAG: AURKAIP1/COX24 domain-containing protein [Acidimicrobiaceae bacterium]|nr:AURKAIP1/COX24 domain-containing protein [Acidimicrobiaceae bacterium]
MQRLYRIARLAPRATNWGEVFSSFTVASEVVGSLIKKRRKRMRKKKHKKMMRRTRHQRRK